MVEHTQPTITSSRNIYFKHSNIPLKPPVEKTNITGAKYLVDVMYVGESVKLGIHGVEHVDNIDGLAGSADVGEGHHVTEQNSAHLKVP